MKSIESSKEDHIPGALIFDSTRKAAKAGFHVSPPGRGAETINMLSAHKGNNVNKSKDLLL